MSRRFLLPLAMGALLVGGAPAFADPNGSTENENEVQCGSTHQVAAAEGVHVYAGGDPTADGGSAGVCSDGQGAVDVVQGRANISGSTGSGARVVVDGDQDNPTPPNGNETARGYIVVEKGPGVAVPTYYCGDEEGKRDSDVRGPNDTDKECEPGS